MKYYVYGLGKEATILYTTRFLESIDGFIEDDANKLGKRFIDKPIVSLNEAIETNSSLFIVVSEIYSYDKIKKELLSRGLNENRDFVWGPNWCGDDNLPSPYDFRTWESMDQERDFTIWNNRTGVALEMLCEDCHSVMDLGAGGMGAKAFLQEGIQYYPVDFCQRYPETIVCDFNKGEFPKKRVDTILALGILQYVKDPSWFISKICESCDEVILSYSTIIESSRNFAGRQRRGCRNHLKIVEIMKMFIINGFLPADERLWEGYDCCIKFVKKDVFWQNN